VLDNGIVPVVTFLVAKQQVVWHRRTLVGHDERLSKRRGLPCGLVKWT
jgi:hypothetical protein